MKKIIGSIALAYILVGCSKNEKEYIQPKEGKIHQTVEQNSTVARNASFMRLTDTVVGNDVWILSQPDSVEVTVIVGDSWGNKMSYFNSYANNLVPNKIIIRAIGGTTHADYMTFLSRLRKHNKRVKTVIVHLGTNDIGLRHPMTTIQANARKTLDTIYSMFPYSKVYLNYVEPHMRHIVRGWREEITQLNGFYDELVTQYRAKGRKIDIIDTYKAFSTGDRTNMSLYGPDSLHYDADGEVVLRNLWLNAAKNSDGKSDRTSPAPSTNKPPVARYNFTAGYPNFITTLKSQWFPVLNANASVDPDGNVTKWEWKQVSGPSTVSLSRLTEADGVFRGRAKVSGWTKAGSYTFSITVTDNQGATGSTDMTVTVN